MIGALGHWGWGNSGDTSDIIKCIDFNIGSEISLKPWPKPNFTSLFP